jgi:hypothetical protein
VQHTEPELFDFLLLALLDTQQNITGNTSNTYALDAKVFKQEVAVAFGTSPIGSLSRYTMPDTEAISFLLVAPT